MTPRRVAVALTIAGVLAVAAGVAWIYPPAGLIAFGAQLAAIGLFGIDDGRPTP